MSKLKILGIRKIRKDKGLGRLTSTSYINGKKVSSESKLYNPKNPGNFISITKKWFKG